MQFRGGTYHLPATERLTAADSGSPSLKITYAGFPGESPMISGGVRLQNWTNISGNTWKTTLPPSTAYFTSSTTASGVYARGSAATWGLIIAWQLRST